MRELLVTQCPHCQTRFRLTAEQLNVAAGRVRCGACLEVFHAIDAATMPEQSAPLEQPTPARPSIQPDAQQAQESLLCDDLDEPDLAALGLDESIMNEVNPVGLADGASTEQASRPGSTTPAFELHEDFLATPPAQDFGADFDHNRTGLHSLLSEADYPDNQHQRQATQPNSRETADRPETASQVGEAYPLYDSDNETPDFLEPEDRRLEPQVTPLHLEMLEAELLAEPTARRRSPSWLWTSLTLLALLALPAQYLYYNFDALARDQRSRPLLESLCLLARCELPARVDISRIRSTNLLLRPHPEFPNALAIDVILYNRADFEQPFPVLEMQFSDPAGRPLTSRRFRPEEYLSGELAGASLMPSQIPIHVGLSMLDPGQQAGSYRLEFHSP